MLSVSAVDAKSSFRDDGVVHLPQLLDPEWLELIVLGIDRNVKNPGPYAQRLYPDTERETYLDYCNYGAIPEYRILLQDSPIVDVVADLLGTEQLWLFFEQIGRRNPASPVGPPGTRTPRPGSPRGSTWRASGSPWTPSRPRNHSSSFGARTGDRCTQA